MERFGKADRRTTETQAAVEINLDGKGRINCKTGIGFFDHMLTLLALTAA